MNNIIYCKKHIATVLVVAVLNLTGCYSFQTVSSNRTNDFYPPEDKPIKLILNNGNEVKAEAYHHTYVDSATYYIIGTGKKIINEKIELKYEGRLYNDVVDTCKIFLIEQKDCLSCLIKDNSRIVFEEGNYIQITPESEKGLWLTGDMYMPNEISRTTKKISGLINQNDIAEIEIEKLNPDATVLFSIGLAIVVGFLIYAAVVGSNFKVFEN